MDFHRGQTEALELFLRAIRISPRHEFNILDWGRLSEFRDQVLKAAPWKNLLGGNDFTRILWRSLYAAISPSVPRDYDGSLEDIPDAFEAAVDVVRTAFQALPLEYEIYIPLGGFPKLGNRQVEVCPSIAIVDAESDAAIVSVLDPLVRSPNPLARGLLGLGAWNDETSPASTRYLRIRENGYGDYSAESPAMRAALARAKHFIALAMQCGTLHVRDDWAEKWDQLPHDRRSRAFIVAIGAGTGFEVELPTDLMNYLHRLTPARSLELQRPTGNSLLDFKTYVPTTPEELGEAIQASLERASKVLSLPQDVKDASRLRAAMEWQIDAAATHNESIAFLQRCIALEALLGSEDSQRSVSDRLSDRYAYLLGRTESEREGLRASFKRMYGHRSDIVHGRAGRLSEQHQVAAAEAHNILNLVLHKETSNLVAAQLAARARMGG